MLASCGSVSIWLECADVNCHLENSNTAGFQHKLLAFVSIIKKKGCVSAMMGGMQKSNFVSQDVTLGE